MGKSVRYTINALNKTKFKTNINISNSVYENNNNI